MTRIRRCFLLFALLGIAGVLSECGGLVDPELPSNAEQFSPPLVYARWWAMTEACSAASGSLASVSWFATSGSLRDPRTGEPIEGYWSTATNRIVLAGNAKLDGGTVRHEMLHALLRQVGHPRAQFLGSCAGVVDCTEHCIRDAGPAPAMDPNAIQVPPDSLEIGVDVAPAAPSTAQDDGFFTITVTARNAALHPVLVSFSVHKTPPTTFAFDVQGPSARILGGEVELDPSVTTFAPGETKQQVFDFVIGNDLSSNALPPGVYTVRGAYGEHWATHAPVVINP